AEAKSAGGDPITQPAGEFGPVERVGAVEVDMFPLQRGQVGPDTRADLHAADRELLHRGVVRRRTVIVRTVSPSLCHVRSPGRTPARRASGTSNCTRVLMQRAIISSSRGGSRRRWGWSAPGRAI